MKFEDDTIDETRELELLLRGKIGSEGSSSAVQVDFAELRGTHATPLAQVSLLFLPSSNKFSTYNCAKIVG